MRRLQVRGAGITLPPSTWDEALAKRKSPKEALDSAAAEWDKITDRRGRDKQKALWGEKMSEMKQVGIEYHPDWAQKAK